MTYFGTHLQLDDFNLVCYDRRFIALVESVIEHLDGIVVKLVRETRPVEGKRHSMLVPTVVVVVKRFTVPARQDESLRRFGLAGSLHGEARGLPGFPIS